jgi:uncharacterized protein
MSESTTKAWWKEPMMWLVVGGPAVVVVAALSTVWIAVQSADTVLPRAQVQAKNATELPALQGRNHVADPNKVLR